MIRDAIDQQQSKLLSHSIISSAHFVQHTGSILGCLLPRSSRSVLHLLIASQWLTHQKIQHILLVLQIVCQEITCSYGFSGICLSKCCRGIQCRTRMISLMTLPPDLFSWCVLCWYMPSNCTWTPNQWQYMRCLVWHLANRVECWSQLD